jgi:purine-binding chemotaxis protein CheW
MSESEVVQPAAPVLAPASDWRRIARSASENHASQEGDEVFLREFLVFGLEGSAYAIPVEAVREIIRMRALTAIPRAPAWLLGVVALRGEIVEVIDLRRRLGIGVAQPSRASRIIVLHGDSDRVSAVLVDSVSEVYRVDENELIPAQATDVSSVLEMCRRGADFISILDLDRVLGMADG